MPVRYLALGDSYTIGEGVHDTQRWPAQLVTTLRDDGIDIAPPRYIAKTGWTCEELAAAIDAEEPLGTWDVVSLCVGVNDQYRGYSLADFDAQYARVLGRALRLAGDRADRVLALTIPDWGATRFAAAEGRDREAIRRDIDAFNAIVATQCSAHRIALVDVTAASRDGGDADAMLVDDGLHPSAAMYARWVALLAPAMHALLGARA